MVTYDLIRSNEREDTHDYSKQPKSSLVTKHLQWIEEKCNGNAYQRQRIYVRRYTQTGTV